MNPDMARGAVLKSGVRHVVGTAAWHWLSGAFASEVARAVVALQAHREYDRPAQQPRVGGSMRHVTRLAPVDADGGMLEHERTPLLGMAFETGLFIPERLLYHTRPGRHSPCRMKGPVRIVAVGAGHESFVYAVLEGKRELRSYIGVTSVAELSLWLGKQPDRRLRVVNGMAARTRHSVQGVFRSANVRAAHLLAVTSQTCV